ncbi:hypothetical protein Tco_1244136 [Tanacetum coccineum]
MKECFFSDGVKQWSGVGWLGWWRLSMVLNGGGYVLDAMDILMRPMIWVLFGIFKDLLTNLETQDLLAMVVVVGSSATVVVHVAEEVIEMTNDQAEALSDQEVDDGYLDDEQVKERRLSKRIRVTQEEMVKDEKPKKG